MDTATLLHDNNGVEWKLPSRGPVGMYCMIAAEAAIFTIFIVAYLFYRADSF